MPADTAIKDTAESRKRQNAEWRHQRLRQMAGIRAFICTKYHHAGSLGDRNSAASANLGAETVTSLPSQACAIPGSDAQSDCVAGLERSGGAPAFDHNVAGALTGFGIPAFACTPDLFPDMMAAAIAKRSLSGWASEHGIAHA